MGTYDHKQLLTDWRVGDITNDMATGHTLQHLDLLYQAQASATNNWQALHQEIEELKTTMLALKQENKQLRGLVKRLSKKTDVVTGLNVTVYQLKDTVDSLTQRLDQDSTE